MVSLRRHFVPNPVPPLFGQNRVEAKRRGLLSSIHTRYDENGNRTNNGYTTADNNQMTSDGTYTYLYDEEGNREYRFEDNDQSGTINTGDANITKYVWDHRNRLVEVRDYDDYTDYSGNSPSQVVEYAYDFGNRWVRKVLDSSGDGTSDGSTIFVYDNDHVALQFDDTGTADLTADDLSHRYLHGTAVDQILADEVVTSLGSAGTVRWPLTDNLGTVRDLAEYDSGTDTTSIVNHRVYNAFGEVTSETAPAVDHLFAYTGRPLDEDTDLQNNLHRWYDVPTGRWMSEDPIGFRGRDFNLGRYVNNSVTLALDPTGLNPNQFGAKDGAELIEIVRQVEAEGQRGHPVNCILTEQALLGYRHGRNRGRSAVCGGQVGRRLCGAWGDRRDRGGEARSVARVLSDQ